MNGKVNRIITRILLVVGVLLIASAVIGVTVMQIGNGNAGKRAGKTVEKMYSLMPEVSDGIPDDRLNTDMSMLEIDGENFVGIIEATAYDSVLPIYGTWEKSKLSKYPCRYMGSIYDGSLVIGGSDATGQLDYIHDISLNEAVSVTDTEGMRFTCVVSDIVRTKDVSTKNLTDGEYDLVFFARNSYSFDYTIVRCKYKAG